MAIESCNKDQNHENFLQGRLCTTWPISPLDPSWIISMSLSFHLPDSLAFKKFLKHVSSNLRTFVNALLQLSYHLIFSPQTKCHSVKKALSAPMADQSHFISLIVCCLLFIEVPIISLNY